MQKKIYKIMTLILVFAASLYFFGRNIKENSVDIDAVMEMENAAFPVITLETGNNNINLLHGYSGNIEDGRLRESITPVDSDKTFSVILAEEASKVKRLQYEITAPHRTETFLSGNAELSEEKDGKKKAQIKLEKELEYGKEYAAKIILTISGNKKINYYTILKQVKNAHLQENLKFAADFHAKTLNKGKASDLAIYLETDYTSSQNNLAHVDIRSSLDLISWGNLKPKVVSDIIPTVKEINSDTTAIQLDYYIMAGSGSGTEYYRVKEFFRLRFTATRTYVLKYDRTMETDFDIDRMSVSQNQFKLGITNDLDFDLKENQEKGRMAFVRNGDLWYFDANRKGKIVKVFSFRKNREDYTREAYDQHNIRILKMDEEGNLDFIVYGYMNRGDYEGRCGIILYHYNYAENRIEEQVYVPLSVSYQILKEDLNDFTYLSDNGVFYFSLGEVVFSYNMTTKELKEIAKGIEKENFATPKGSRYIAWQNENDAKKCSKIIIMDLEKETKQELKAPDSETIRLLGSINGYFIYGYGKERDITASASGETVVPLYQVEIADGMGNTVKRYKKKGVYITGCSVKDNIIELERKKKDGDRNFKKTKPDFILNKFITEDAESLINKRTDSKTYTEYYLSLPKDVVLDKKLEVINTKNLVITQDTTLHLNQEEEGKENYYIYAKGSIIGSEPEAGKAVEKADKEMGVVLNRQQYPVWERGTNMIRNQISGITPVTGEGDTACLKMLLTYAVGSSVVAEGWKDKAVEDILKEHVIPLDFTGTGLEQILYSISNNRPVIAWKDKTHAVLIKGYDEVSITVINPADGKEEKLRLSDAGEQFKKAGNIFISYLN